MYMSLERAEYKSQHMVMINFATLTMNYGLSRQRPEK